MFAQKTPTSALLINSTETWNSLYFQDLFGFQKQLIEDYQLRLLLLNFIFKQRSWLQRFSLKKNYGNYFIQINYVSIIPRKVLLPFLINWNLSGGKLVRQNSFSKQIQWLRYFYWHNILTLFNYNRSNALLFNQANFHYYKLKRINYRWVKFIAANNTAFLQLSKKMRKSKIHIFKHFHLLSRDIKNLGYNSTSKETFLHLNVTKRLFVSEVRKDRSNINNNIVVFNLCQKDSLKYFLTNRRSKLLRKSNINRFLFIGDSLLGNMYSLPHKLVKFTRKWLKKYFLRRRTKWYSALCKWMFKWGWKLRFKRHTQRFTSYLSQYQLAAERVTKTKCFFFIKKSLWTLRYYKALRQFLIFERFRYKSYMIFLLVATHFSISQCTPVILLDFLRHLLVKENHHSAVLDGIHLASKYFICQADSSLIKSNRLCKGMKMIVCGKINGSMRKKKWSFLLGGIPRHVLSSSINYDQTNISTRYGMLHVHLWYCFEIQPILQASISKYLTRKDFERK